MDLQAYFFKSIFQVSDVSAAGQKQETVQDRSPCSPLHHSSKGLIYWFKTTGDQSGLDNQAATVLVLPLEQLVLNALEKTPLRDSEAQTGERGKHKMNR